MSKFVVKRKIRNVDDRVDQFNKYLLTAERGFYL